MGSSNSKKENDSTGGFFPDATKSLGIGGVASAGLFLLGTPISWVVYAGVAAGAINYTREVSEKASETWYGKTYRDAAGNIIKVPGVVNSVNYYVELAWKLAAIYAITMGIYYIRRFQRNLTKENNPAPVTSAQPVVVLPTPAAPTVSPSQVSLQTPAAV